MHIRPAVVPTLRLVSGQRKKVSEPKKYPFRLPALSLTLTYQILSLDMADTGISNAAPFIVAVEVDVMFDVISSCATSVQLEPPPPPSYVPVTPKILTSFLMFPALRFWSERIFVASLA